MLKLKKKNKLWNSCKWREIQCFVLPSSATLSEHFIDRVAHIHNQLKKSKTSNRIYPLDVGPKISKYLTQRMKLFKRTMHHTPFYNFICAVLQNNQCTSCYWCENACNSRGKGKQKPKEGAWNQVKLYHNFLLSLYRQTLPLCGRRTWLAIWT